MGATIISWITSVLGDEMGKIIGVIFISMLPVIELRGAIPVAFALGLDWKTAVLCSVIGNLLPMPFILMFLETVFKLMKKYNIFGGLVDRLQKKAAAKNASIAAYEFWGLVIFVGIPLPGTGGWTGALVASVMKMPRRKAFLSILLGVLIAAAVVTTVTYGLVGYLIG